MLHDAAFRNVYEGGNDKFHFGKKMFSFKGIKGSERVSSQVDSNYVYKKIIIRIPRENGLPQIVVSLFAYFFLKDGEHFRKESVGVPRVHNILITGSGSSHKRGY